MSPDPYPIENSTACTDPSIVPYLDALRDHTAQIKRLFIIATDMVRRDDNRMRRDSDAATDTQSAMAIKDSEWIDTAVVADRYVATVSQDHREVVYLTVMSHHDRSTPAHADHATSGNGARGVDVDPPASPKPQKVSYSTYRLPYQAFQIHVAYVTHSRAGLPGQAFHIFNLPAHSAGKTISHQKNNQQSATDISSAFIL